MQKVGNRNVYILTIVCLLFSLLSCRDNKKLPPPPAMKQKHEVHYKGKIYELSESEYKKMLDSLKIDTTKINKID